jgi:hypothetical protein
MSYEFDKTLAIEQFQKRKKANKGKQVDNSSLMAGSPMYFYCKYCGEHTETLPEGYWSKPKTKCDACKLLREHGLIDDEGKVY